jgi:signal transduction histidine kinase
MKNNKSLFRSLQINILVITIIPLLIFTALISVRSLKNLRSLSDDKSIVVLNTLEYQVESFIERELKTMEEFKFYFENYYGSDLVGKDFVVDMLIENSRYSDFFIINDEGVVIEAFPNNKDVLGTDQSYYGYFKYVDNQGYYWSDTFFDSAYNMPRVALSTNLNDYILVGYIDLGELNRFITNVNSNDNTKVYLVDGSGTYIAHSNIDKVKYREKDKSFIHWLFGSSEELEQYEKENDSRYKISQIDDTNWYIVIEESLIPEKMLSSAIMVTAFVVIFIILVLLVIFARIRTDMIKSVFNNFIQKIETIGSGEYGEKIKDVEYLEFKALSDKFNEMSESISIRENTIVRMNSTLEKKIEERTKMLHESNEELRQAIEDLKDTQNKLIESEKMASLGQLVAGIAHEINTPLGNSVTSASFIHTKTESLKESLFENKLDKDSFVKYLDDVEKSSDILLESLERSSELVKSFKQIAVDQSLSEKVYFNPASTVESVVKSFNVKAKKNNIKINFNHSIEENLLSWPGKISQIVMNLIQNAIVHGFKNLDGGTIDVELTYDLEKLILRVKDNGNGIDRDIVKKIYDPFFTTGRGQGSTGLGLNIVYNIVQSVFDGEIKCNSELGKGTEFIVFLNIKNN